MLQSSKQQKISLSQLTLLLIENVIKNFNGYPESQQ